ncbi:Est-6 [Trypoxylus dichotomus]
MLAVNAHREDTRPVIPLEDGLVRGSFRKSYNGRIYTAFEGIPYAQPPVQHLRFEDPQPVKPWTGILEATATYMCMQLKNGKPAGQEDCLYLNVYIPREKINPEENLDVIVHIHGGAFVVGNPETYAGAGIIMDKDVVFVTMNYRLGAFGFYSTGNGISNGNFGLKDQVLALKWVNNNIHNFGGNNRSITITGLSAGAASVHLHYFSPMSRGLFHRGFAQSGTALAPWVIRKDPEVKARVLAETVGCPTSDMACLKQRSAVQLVGTLSDGGALTIDFGPTIEPNSSSSFLTEMPYPLLKSNKVLDVPLLLSVVTGEGTLPCGLLYGQYKYLNENWNNVLPTMLDYYTEPKKRNISQRLKNFYLQDEPVSAENFAKIIKMCSDRAFFNGARKTAELQGPLNGAQVFVLVIGYVSKGMGLSLLGVNNDVKLIRVADVSHGTDGRFFFQNYALGPPNLSKEEVRMKNILLDMLMSFVKTGKPKVKGVDFEPVSKSGEFDYVLIRAPNNITLKSGDSLGHMEFWDSLGMDEGQNVIPL